MTLYQTCARYFRRWATTLDNCAASSKQRVAGSNPARRASLCFHIAVRPGGRLSRLLEHRGSSPGGGIWKRLGGECRPVAPWRPARIEYRTLLGHMPDRLRVCRGRRIYGFLADSPRDGHNGARLTQQPGQASRFSEAFASLLSDDSQLYLYSCSGSPQS